MLYLLQRLTDASAKMERLVRESESREETVSELQRQLAAAHQLDYSIYESVGDGLNAVADSDSSRQEV